ncbi:MAG: hypothetical protein JST20_00005, partial [Bacteroidetes bacterium]|nr:hypothetical protein [Bacteroidota bacterium]
YPKIHVSTAKAYSSVIPNEQQTDYASIFNKKKLTTELLKNNIRNDFEVSVFAQYPLLAEIKQTLLECGALFSLMSGSGSSIFGLFSDENIAFSAATKLSRYQAFVCRQHTFK